MWSGSRVEVGLIRASKGDPLFLISDCWDGSCVRGTNFGSADRGQAFERRNASASDFQEMICRQFDVLHREGDESGRVMHIALHPYLTGLPYRIDAMDRALAYICRHEGVWLATGSEIARTYRNVAPCPRHVCITPRSEHAAEVLASLATNRDVRAYHPTPIVSIKRRHRAWPARNRIVRFFSSARSCRSESSAG